MRKMGILFCAAYFVIACKKDQNQPINNNNSIESQPKALEKIRVDITNLQPKTEDSVYPFVTVNDNKTVSDKINTFLQVSDLENIPNSRKNPFELALNATNTYSNYIYFYDWKKVDSPSNILTLFFSGEASGAYSEGFENWRNFDLRTGNYINSKDFFKRESIKSVDKLIITLIKKEINDFLTTLKKAPISAENQELIDMYEDCIASADYRTLEYTDVFFDKDAMVFVSERCSNHAMLGMDELDNFKIKIPFKTLQPYFSDFGKTIISETETIAQQPGVENRLYKGKIDNKHAITLLITEIYSDGTFSALYWYDQQKKLIEWHGSIKNNHLSLVEDDYYDEKNSRWIARANIELDLRDNQLTGTWKDLKNNKTLNIKLQSY